jgi:EmrB/QacA subfamily drug resistance transporter
MTEPTAPAVPARTPAPGMTHRQIMILLVALMLSMLLAALDLNAVTTALPTIAGRLGGLQQLPWVVTVYLLAMTVSTPLYGKLSDLRGPKQMVLAAIVIFVAGSMLTGLSQNMTTLVAFRAVQGVGAGGVIAVWFTIAGHVVSPRDAGRYQWYNGIVWSLATAAGPLVGGLLTQHVSWRWVFFINVPVGVAAFIATAALLRLPAGQGRREHEIDYPGVALLTGAAACLCMVTVWGGQRYAWHSATILTLTAAGAVLAIAFVIRERRAAEPILSLSLFGDPAVAIALAATFLLGLVMFTASVFLPMYLQVVKAMPPANAGLFLLPLWVCVTLASFVTGALITKTGRYKLVLLCGTGLITASMYLFSRLGSRTPDLAVLGAEVLLGCGLGSVISKLIVVIQNSVDRRELTAGMAASQFFREFGGALGTAVFGAVLAARLLYWRPRLLTAKVIALTPSHIGANLYSDPASIGRLRLRAPALYHGLIEMLARSLHPVYASAVPLAALAFLLTFLLPKRKLQTGETWHSRPAPARAAERAGASGPSPVA